MMTDDEIIQKANEAYHARNLKEAEAWISLLHAVQYSEKRIAERVEEARTRIMGRRLYRDHPRNKGQHDYQRDYDEYIEEMSLGGQPYNKVEP